MLPSGCGMPAMPMKVSGLMSASVAFARLQRECRPVSLLDLAADSAGLLRGSRGYKNKGNGRSAERPQRHIQIVHYESPPDLGQAKRPATVRQKTPLLATYSFAPNR